MKKVSYIHERSKLTSAMEIKTFFSCRSQMIRGCVRERSGTALRLRLI